LEELARRKHILRELAGFYELEVNQVQTVVDECALSLQELEECLQVRVSGPVATQTKSAVTPRSRSTNGESRSTVSNGSSASRIDLKIREVALAYFKWLYEFLRQPCEAQGIDITQVPVRVCVPAFPANQSPAFLDAQEYLAEILDAVGWKLHPSDPVIVEPLANAIGVLTGGVNRTWVPQKPKGAPRDINLREMFGDGAILQAWKGRSHVVLVLDVGAYTADFALIKFLPEGEEREVILTGSHPLGIVQELDQRVRQELMPEQAEVVAGLSVGQMEVFRKTVYDENRPVRFGGKATVERKQLEAIQRCVVRYAADIVTYLNQCFVGHADKIQELVLTGGGNNIRAIREVFRKHLTPRGLQVLHSVSTNGSLVRTDTFHPLGQELARGGSAIGGTSIYFDYPKK
jgi:hypothetical protein